jgi:hypothetical protein
MRGTLHWSFGNTPASTFVSKTTPIPGLPFVDEERFMVGSRALTSQSMSRGNVRLDHSQTSAWVWMLVAGRYDDGAAAAAALERVKPHELEAA